MQGVSKKWLADCCGAPAQSAVNAIIVVNENHRYHHNPSSFNFHHRHHYNSVWFSSPFHFDLRLMLIFLPNENKPLRWIANLVQIFSEAKIKIRNLEGTTNVYMRMRYSNTSQMSCISNKTKCQSNLISDGFIKQYLASILQFPPIGYCFGS